MAAYLRLLGASQKAAAAAIGRSERTIRNWEAETALWTKASEEARQRWLTEVTAMARRQLLKGLMTADAEMALKVIERLDADLAPPAHRLKHEGQVDLMAHPAWIELRTMILQALAPYPEARVHLAGVLMQEGEAGYEHRNGTSNGTHP